MLKLKWAYLLDVAEHLHAAVVLEHTLGDGCGCHTTDRLTRRGPEISFEGRWISVLMDVRSFEQIQGI